ncbi:MAG: GGDEF domain-containing protein [Oscillospiraceae bacterium]|nr:GGDEF domain-containing protein [Oscillospiraceae bacterium]
MPDEYLLQFAAILATVSAFLVLAPVAAGTVQSRILALLAPILPALLVLLAYFYTGEGAALRKGALLLLLFVCVAALFYLSAHRDARFIYLLSQAGLVALITVQLAAGLLGSLVGAAAGLLVMSLAVCWVIHLARVQKPLFASDNISWPNLSLCAVAMLLFAFFLCAYPKPNTVISAHLPLLAIYGGLAFVLYSELLRFAALHVSVTQAEHARALLKAKLSLKNSQLEMQKLYDSFAQTDALTGIGNRAALERNRLSAEANWQSLMPAVCYSFDLNNLKQINDTRGHASGDQALCDIAQLLRETFCDTPEVYRLGGDEFLVMGYQIEQADAKARLADFYERLAAHNAQQGQEISCAAGMAFTQNADMTFALLMSEADRKMYENKRKAKP